MTTVQRAQSEPGTERLVLPPAADSPRAARRWLGRALSRLGADEQGDVAALLLTELVTNAVLHAGSSVVVLLRVVSDELHVEVRDESPTVPRRRHHASTSTTGRGIALVEELADRWGCDRHESGKAVWFRLALAPAGGPAS